MIFDIPMKYEFSKTRSYDKNYYAPTYTIRHLGASVGDIEFLERKRRRRRRKDHRVRTLLPAPVYCIITT